jgi:predicted DNA-binding protein (UPF0251 family)
MSPRHKKARHCECAEKGGVFKPARIPMKDLKRISFFRDELEALRLCDYKGLTQAQAATKMGISRSTVQRILTEARKKTAMALTECMAIELEEPVCDNTASQGKRSER